jgi:RimJ/RimL family protein N-acetyltransferase
MLCDINVLWFLSGFLPVLGLMQLGYINPQLVKAELVHRLNIVSLILVLGIIVGLPILGAIYVYDPESLIFFLSLLIKIRFLFIQLIFIFILIFWFYMPWTKDNLIKAGVLLFSLWLLGTLVNTTGKLSNLFLNINTDDSSPTTQAKALKIETELKLVDFDKLRAEIFPILSSCEDLQDRKDNIINIKPAGREASGRLAHSLSQQAGVSVRPFKAKYSIFDYIISKRTIDAFIKPTEEWKKLNKIKYELYLKGKLLKIKLGFIEIDPNKKNKYTFHKKNDIRYTTANPILTNDYCKKDSSLTFNSKFCKFLWNRTFNSNFCNILWNKTILIQVPSNFQIDTLNSNPITTERLIIRPLRPSDALAYALCLRDPGIGWPLSLHHIYEKVSYALSSINNYGREDDGRKVNLGVFLKNIDGVEYELIGKFGLYISELGSGLDYFIKKKYWSQKYGSEALDAILQYYYSLPFTEVECKFSAKYLDKEIYKYNGRKILTVPTFTFNEKSENLLKKMGFRLWYFEKGLWSKEDNELTRLIEERGYDIFQGDGFTYYNWIKIKLDPLHSEYLWPRYIIMPSYSEDGFFFFKNRNLYRAWKNHVLNIPQWTVRDRDRILPQDLNNWILSENDIKKK